MKSCFGTFEQSVAGVRDDQSSKDDDSNALLLPAKKKSKMKVTSQSKLKGTPCLTKNQKRKLKQLQDEKEKRSLQSKSIKILERYKIQDDAYSLLCSSGSLGQVETMKEKRRRAVQFSRAGLEMPEDLPSFKKRRETASFQHEVTAKPDSDKSYLRQGCHGNDLLQPSASENVNLNNACVASASYLKPNCGSTLGKAFGSERSSTITESTEKNTVACMEDDQKISPIASSSYERGKDTKSLDVEGVPKIDRLNISVLADSSVEKPANDRTVVHVSRPKEVESKRGDLPIVMMEQEIMEAINEQPTVIICGETGCGKTTQVPQFLYEAGFGSSTCTNRRGIIGVTQPRRVAVLATAKRVAFELGLRLGKEVGFQVRHDKRIGNNCSIKFMTDGILLREVQSDFLLKRYSIIILDEAHERSLNTDILIGMLSRIMRVRQRLYVEQQEKVLSGVKISPENMITELKIVLMSATLRVEDFLSNRRLFREPPPIIEVQTRQFPVTVHFSKRTEIVDYMGQSYKKVMSIHKKLPPGGILVFVTGQREVEYLCRKLRKASRQLVENTYKGNTNDEVSAISEVDNAEHGPDMKDISEAFEIPSHSSDPLRFSSYNEDSDYIDRDSYTSDSGTDDDLGVDSDYEIHGSYEKTGMLVDVLREARSIASLKAAFEALSGKEPKANAKEKLGLSVAPDIEGCPKLSPSSGIKHGAYGLCPGALHVLPLYAMLPAAAQLRVFEGIPEGERLVVVATNVAETSLTIPGIKYVVDTGREKVKNYNCTNGMATYEVQWISKASAAQRAGRAGRTGPGHCYRLYSSAVFNNIFSDFSCAEITKTPVDGVFLLMKSMGIDKVANFPFPTPPETTALMEAECCLKALEALDSQGRLTPIGKAMAQYPMSPRHSCMLLTVIQIMGEQTVYARANLVLGYAIAAAAALSFSNPFIMQFDGGSRDDLDQGETCDAMGGHPKNNAKTEKILDQQERMRQKKLKAMAKMARAKFCNPTSDALTVAYALQLFELAESPFEFCKNHALHLKTMDEMSKLRKQLLQLIFHQSATVGSKQEFSWIHGNMEDVEHAWRILADKYPLALNEENLLGQAICAGWADRVAKRIRTVSELSDRDKKANAVRYQACFMNETVFLHRWSSVSQSAPEFLVYNELLHTKRPYMHGVTSVKSDWLIKYAGSLCSFSSPLTDPKPYYEPKTEQVLCWVSPTFGPHLWKLPLHSLPIKDDMLRVSVFACALLEGNVLPCLKSAQRFMAAPPSSILRPEASGQRRVGNLLNKFKVGLKTIDSRAKLRGAWKENPQELHWEIMQWFQEKFHNQFEELWAKMQHEVLLETRELFPKKMKRKERK